MVWSTVLWCYLVTKIPYPLEIISPDLVAAYDQAYVDMLVYGTGFIKVVDGEILMVTYEEVARTVKFIEENKHEKDK